VPIAEASSWDPAAVSNDESISADEATADGMLIEGKPDGAAFRGGEIDSRGDHRIAMAFSVASLRAAQPIAVRDTANVATSFPGFVALARAVGLDLAESSVSRA